MAGMASWAVVRYRCRRSMKIAAFALMGLIGFTGVGVSPSAAQDAVGPTGQKWCQTWEIFQSKIAQTRSQDPNACSQEGVCDAPTLRDDWVPAADQPYTIIRLYFHVLCNDDGSGCSATAQKVADQVANLNVDYAPSRIQFEYEMRFVNSSTYRSLTDGEMNGMKNAYALKPDSQLNIFVSFVEGSYSFGTFPWDSDALTKTGGIVMTIGHFNTVQSTLAHEVGHCLGLWHTHHGVSEVAQCSGCYEKVNALDRDFTGDFCSDTDPTPVHYSCGGPPGIDTCTGQSWGPTDTWNYMGYSGETCWSAFSTQQKGRMHCWFNQMLQSWSSGVRFAGDNVFGPAPLSVDFTGITTKTVNSWLWEFGDGATSNAQNPSHTYAPGYYDVQVTIQATDGTFEARELGFVSAHADSLIGATANTQPNADVRVDVYARNYLPIQDIRVPFQWSGPFNLTLDSVSTLGLRTEYFETQKFLSFSFSTKSAVYQLLSSANNNVPPLAPGTGPIMSLWFSTPAGLTGGPNIIDLDGYDTQMPIFITDAGSYNPLGIDGAVIKCKPGDVNGDNTGPDIGDLNAVIDFLFQGGIVPANPGAADANHSGDIDISDLQYFIDFLFFGGPAPQGC